MKSESLHRFAIPASSGSPHHGLHLPFPRQDEVRVIASIGYSGDQSPSASLHRFALPAASFLPHHFIDLPFQARVSFRIIS
jgi:hypothetical protein